MMVKKKNHVLKVHIGDDYNYDNSLGGIILNLHVATTNGTTI